jgi:hypothetical protein
MNGKLERIRKEAVVILSRYYHSICLQEPTITSVNLILGSATSEVRTKHTLKYMYWNMSGGGGRPTISWWLRHNSTSRKVAGSTFEDILEVYSASNRNEYQKQRNNVSGE